MADTKDMIATIQETETKPADVQPIENTEAKSVEPKLVEPKSVETKSVEPKSVEAKSIEIKYEKPKMEILALNIQYAYNLNQTHVTDYLCKLCKRNIAAPTHEDIATGTIVSAVCLGKCGHTFHKKCIDRYIRSGQVACPIDMTVWNLDRELDSIPTMKMISITKPSPSGYIVTQKK